MRNYSIMSEQDIKDMYEMFESGLKSREICELTGRHASVVGRYKKKWKTEKKSEPAALIEEVPEQKTEVVESKKEESDYAKAY